MSRRVARLGTLLLFGLLLGSLGLAAPAAGQQQEPLKVALRDVQAASGRLKVTVGMSGSSWTGSERLDAGNFTVAINGRTIQGVQATPLQEQQGASGQLAVFLAVDTSGSMKENNNIDTARNAAVNFVGQMRPGTRMGVISFADEPKVVQALTTDPGQVRAAIQGLQASGNTALYDAVVRASSELKGQPGQRNLVVLSDGRHDGTPTKITDAIAAARQAKVTVNTVGLEVPGRDQDQEALRRLAEGTKGRWAPVTAENLEALFENLGRDLASQYVVDLELPPNSGSQVDFRLTV
jgi:VWFA-related protein